MTLEVLHVPDCPNLAPMLERLAEVTDRPVTTREIRSDDDAVKVGMAGSPTLLIDGIDPFAEAASAECGLACRLYRDEAGRIVPVPSTEQLRAALAARRLADS
ncbi:hypothetical protein ACQPYH_04095 [Kribbella sp. CA-245084]|uniref:hypothetical protein n=1 Tax=Kribbella sp. CA-245084 TaxID=3239940 RepID=UPI003D8AC333